MLFLSSVEPPRLKSGQLTITRIENTDRSVTVRCGPILTLGKPPVNILFKVSLHAVSPFLWLIFKYVIHINRAQPRELNALCHV